VLDPAREKSLLENRRQWARELGLNEEMVEEVFRTLLRVSRRVQAGQDSTN
jgi:prephenate dehydrogenase